MEKNGARDTKVRIVNYYALLGGFCLIQGLIGMDGSGPSPSQQLSLVCVGAGQGFSGTGSADAPRTPQQSFVIDPQRNGNQQIAQIFERLLFVRNSQMAYAQQFFGLHNSIEVLRKQLEAQEKELSDLESSFRQQDPSRMEQAAFDDLASALANGCSLAGVSGRQFERPFLLYLREQACAHRNSIILAKLLETDQQVKADIASLGLFALTDDPQEVTGNVDKMKVLAQAGIDMCQVKNVDSPMHTLVREQKEEVVRQIVERTPQMVGRPDGKGRTVLEVATIRYVDALIEHGRRSSEYEEAYKILKLLAAQSQQAQQGQLTGAR